jgi:hypothetical protein
MLMDGSLLFQLLYQMMLALMGTDRLHMPPKGTAASQVSNMCCVVYSWCCNSLLQRSSVFGQPTLSRHFFIRNRTFLQENHTHARHSGHGDDESDGEETGLDARNGVYAGAALAGRGGARAAAGGAGASTGRRTSHGAGTSGATRLAHERRASRAAGRGGLERRGAAEVASARGAGLLDVVVVEGEGELLGAVAHAVRTVVAGGRVGGEAGADAVAVAADGAEESAVVGSVDARGNNAGQGVVHAAAELLVGSRRERGGLGGPGGADGRAVSRGVGGAVGAVRNAARGDVGDLAGVVVEVGQGADSVAGDRDETCALLDMVKL